MNTQTERRREQRLRYHWPIWFAEDFDGILSQGQMADVSSKGAAFTCYADESCPSPGQNITARFSVPRYQLDEAFDMADFTRSGHICRVDSINGYLRRVAIQFAEPLPFKPGEQANAKAEPGAESTLTATTA
ncbi:MAG: PilZ domain-containing protein [Phycisphaerales bacterium]|nr:MAG: PilZ domain-containing protein [Phycisphaerales bacterium]